MSGFFGSGKSSFAKNLGYALQNRKVLGEDFATSSSSRSTMSGSATCSTLINAQIPTEVILFEVAKEQDTRKVTQRIAELMYTVLLRELGYAEDFDIAELEIELEAEGKLDEFIATCKKLHEQDWRIGPEGGAEALPCQCQSCTSSTRRPTPRRTRGRTPSGTGMRRSPSARSSSGRFELVGRRRHGKALVFIIDEVGQHVARSGDKIEDLRATVEEFGKVGKNLLKARKITAPCWIVVTSQEKLDEVVAAIDSQAGRTGQAARPLPLPGRSRPFRHPGSRHQACLGEEARSRARLARSCSPRTRAV